MNAITISNIADVKISVDISAFEKREALVAAAREVTSVSDDFTKGIATESWRDLETLLKAVETSRVAVKGPVLGFGRSIDELAKGFCEPLITEVNRIKVLVNSFNIAEEKKRQEAERARQAELQRIADEKARVERESAAAVAAAQRAAQEATNAEQRKAAVARIDAEAAESRRKQAELAAQALTAKTAVVAAPVKSDGEVIEKIWKFEVTNIGQLVQARPDLCRIEANALVINSEIRGGARNIPGIRIWEAVQTEVRS